MSGIGINLAQMRRVHRQFEAKFTATVDRVAAEAAAYELQNARQRLTVHRRTGRLSAETNTRVIRLPNQRLVRLENYAMSKGVGYASYVDMGNGTGYIYPRTASALRFRIGPLFIFAKRVRAYRGSLVFTRARRSGFLQAGFLLRSQLDALARTF